MKLTLTQVGHFPLLTEKLSLSDFSIFDPPSVNPEDCEVKSQIITDQEGCHVI